MKRAWVIALLFILFASGFSRGADAWPASALPLPGGALDVYAKTNLLDATNGLVVAHCDEQGSVVALSDPAGVLLHSAAYGPFGEDWGSSGENPTPFAWLGSWGVRRVPGSDAVGPLFLTARRLYAPSLRRFLSPDPLGPAGGLNPYAYGGGNPLEWIDPFGLCPVHDPLGEMANGSDSSGVEFLTRLGGFAQMVGGTLESALGLGFAAFTAETGLGVFGGLTVAAHGWDVATAGWDTMVSGDPQDSMTSQSMQSIGVPRNWANGLDAAISAGGSMGISAATGTAQGLQSTMRAGSSSSEESMVLVSRWGREGLKSGDWVMKGPASRFNYIMSGKGQPRWMPGHNIPAPRSSGTEYLVPASSLKNPTGWEVIKTLLGQHIYIGPGM